MALPSVHDLPRISNEDFAVDAGGGVKTLYCFRCGEYLEDARITYSPIRYHDNPEECVKNLGHRVMALQAYIEENMLTRGDPVRL